jgi:hypothetical protein
MNEKNEKGSFKPLNPAATPQRTGFLLLFNLIP